MQSTTKRRLGSFCTALGLAGAVLAFNGGVASAHPGPEPPPVVVPPGNFVCSDFAVAHGGGQAWSQVTFGAGELQSGTKDGVTLVWHGDNTFDFNSTIGVDAVFVTSSSGSHLYVYAPTSQTAETFFDDRLTAPQAITHISFCFDGEAATTTAPPPPPTTTTTEATTTTTEAPTTTTTAASGSVAGVTVTAGPSTTAAPAEVGGVQASQAQALPRTGTDNGSLLALSAGLVVGGLILVLLGDGARVLRIRRR